MKNTITLSSPIKKHNKQVGLRWDIETDFHKLEYLRDEWNLLLQRSDGFGYASYDYCSVWWKHYCNARQLLVFIFRIDEKLIGVIPLFIEKVSLGPVKLKVAKLLASDHVYSLCDPAIEEKYASKIIQIVKNQIIEEYSCDALSLAPISGTGNSQWLLTKSPSIQQVVSKDIGVHTYFLLPNCFDEYLKNLKKHYRGNYRRAWKFLQREYEIQEEVCIDKEQVIQGFEEFQRMHAQQWKQEGKLGHFGDWPGSLEFHRDLVKSLAQHGNCRLYRIIANNKVVSINYAFRFKNKLQWMLPARLTGEPWDQLSLGRLSLMRMIKAAIEEGVEILEAGPGHYPYKARIGATEVNSKAVLFIAPNSNSRFRIKLFGLLARVYDKIYYRIFFSRIAPKLPWMPKPLWRSWIRSRL